MDDKILVVGEGEKIPEKRNGFRLPRITNLPIVAGILNLFKSQRSAMLTVAGKERNLFFYHGGKGAGNFKKNQRKQRAVTRRRKMSTAAR